MSAPFGTAEIIGQALFFIKFWNFMSAHFGTVTQCSVEPTVPKGALRKFQNSSKFCSDLVDIKNSAKDLQTPLKTNEKFI